MASQRSEIMSPTSGSRRSQAPRLSSNRISSSSRDIASGNVNDTFEALAIQRVREKMRKDAHVIENPTMDMFDFDRGTDVRPVMADGVTRLRAQFRLYNFNDMFPVTLAVDCEEDLTSGKKHIFRIVDGQHRTLAAIAESKTMYARLVIGSVTDTDLGVFAQHQNEDTSIVVHNTHWEKLYGFISGLMKHNQLCSTSEHFKLCALHIPSSVMLQNKSTVENPPVPTSSVTQAVATSLFTAALMKSPPISFGSLIVSALSRSKAVQSAGNFPGFQSDVHRLSEKSKFEKGIKKVRDEMVSSWSSENISWLKSIVVWYQICLSYSNAAFLHWAILLRSEFSATFSREFLSNMDIRNFPEVSFDLFGTPKLIRQISCDIINFLNIPVSDHGSFDPQRLLFIAFCAASTTATKRAQLSQPSGKKRSAAAMSEERVDDDEQITRTLVVLSKKSPPSLNEKDKTLSMFDLVVKETEYRFFLFHYLESVNVCVTPILDSMNNSVISKNYAKALATLKREICDNLRKGEISIAIEKNRKYPGYKHVLRVSTSHTETLTKIIASNAVYCSDNLGVNFDSFKNNIANLASAYNECLRIAKQKQEDEERLRKATEEKSRKEAEKAAAALSKQAAAREAQSARLAAALDESNIEGDGMDIDQDDNDVPITVPHAPSSSQCETTPAQLGVSDDNLNVPPASSGPLSTTNVKKKNYEQNRERNEVLLSRKVMDIVMFYPFPFQLVACKDETSDSNDQRIKLLSDVLSLLSSSSVFDLQDYDNVGWLKDGLNGVPTRKFVDYSFDDVKLTLNHLPALKHYVQDLQGHMERTTLNGIFGRRNELTENVALALSDIPFNILDRPDDRISDDDIKQFVIGNANVLKGEDAKSNSPSGSAIVFCTNHQFVGLCNAFNATTRLRTQHSPITVSKPVSGISSNKRTNNLVNATTPLCVAQPLSASGKLGSCYIATETDSKGLNEQNKYPPYSNFMANYCFNSNHHAKLLGNIFDRPSALLGKRDYLRGPQEKHMLLLCEIIRLRSKSGEVVMDFCGGTGTTAIAAMLMNRKAVVCESDLVVFIAALDRLFDFYTWMSGDEHLLDCHVSGDLDDEVRIRQYMIKGYEKISRQRSARGNAMYIDTMVSSTNETKFNWIFKSRRALRERRTLSVHSSSSESDSDSAADMVNDLNGLNDLAEMMREAFYSTSMATKDKLELIRNMELGHPLLDEQLRSLNNYGVVDAKTMDDVLRVGVSSLGDHVGDGLFAKIKLPKGFSVGLGFFGTFYVGFQSIPDLTRACQTSIRVSSSKCKGVFVHSAPGCLAGTVNGLSADMDKSLQNCDLVEFQPWLETETFDETSVLEGLKNPSYVYLELSRDVMADEELITFYGSNYDFDLRVDP